MISPDDVQALLSEHFEMSPGKNYTGLVVRRTDPVVVDYNFGYTVQRSVMDEDQVRLAMLASLEEFLVNAGYVCTLGSAASDQRPVLIVVDRK